VYLTLVHIFLHLFYEQVYCHVIHDKILTIRRGDLEFTVFHILCFHILRSPILLCR